VTDCPAARLSIAQISRARFRHRLNDIPLSSVKSLCIVLPLAPHSIDKLWL
jgi:hypothetical protein